MAAAVSSHLASYVKVLRSPIHGRGCFARRLIPSGAYIGDYLGPRAERDSRYVLWVQQDDGSWAGVRGENELRYLNHSSRPNAEFDGARLFARRDIAEGEEITIHYGDEWKDVL